MRKMATLRRITELRPIEGADAIECAVVDGWTVVVKKGEFNPGDIVIYCEIDSWIPNEVAPFLTKSDHFPKEFNGVKGERLKTVRLRGQLSQGLILPLESLGMSFDVSEGHITIYYVDQSRECFKVNDDISELLGIQRWERPLPAQLAGVAKGNFPTEIPKTDQERCQNLVKEIRKWAVEKVLFEKTEKLDGSSCTFYLDIDGNFRVCSRNIELKEDGNNSFWKAARKYDIEDKMRDKGYFGYALQGELVGEGIQKNRYNIRGQEFRLFDVYDVRGGNYLPPIERESACYSLGILHVPLLSFTTISSYVQNLLDDAEGPSLLNDVEREGVVYKSTDGKISFKAISNKFLLKGGD